MARADPSWPPRGLPEVAAAYYVGVSVGTLRRLADEGEFEATWLTERRKVYLRERLDAFLDRRSAGRNAGTPVEDVPDWQKALDADGTDHAALC